jgi:hypothetical protein
VTDPKTTYRQRPWRVHTLAQDFLLEDLWTFRLGGRPADDVGQVLDVFWSVFHQLERGWLARTRLVAGRAFGWDDHDFTRSIPGCREKSVAERMECGDRQRNLAPPDAPSPVATPIVKTVYLFNDEVLYEASNDTIHTLLHIAIADGEATLGVFVKWRGALSRLYMAAIWPARHLLIYPALVRRIEHTWAKR